MAKLPQVTPEGRPSLASAPAVVSDPAGAQFYEGLETIGNAITQVAIAKGERENKLIYAQAKTKVLLADVESRKGLEDDPDWESWEEKHQSNIKKAIDEAAQNIRSSRDRKLFEQEARLDMARSLAEVRKQARLRYVDEGRANLTSSLEALQKASLETPDPGTRKQLVATAHDIIESAKTADIPLVTAEEAEAIRKQWVANYATGHVSMMNEDEQMRVLKKPAGTPAQYIAPDIRQKMYREAESRNKAQRVRATALEQTDKIIGKYPTATSMRDALSEVSKIKDSDVQIATRTMVKSRYAEMEAADRIRHSEAVDLVADIVEQRNDDGTMQNDLHEIRSTPQWEELSVQERRAAELRYRQVQQGTEPTNDWKAIYEWNQMSQEEQLKADIWAKYRHRTDDTQWQQIENRQRALKDARDGKTGAASDVRDGDNQSQMIADRLLQTGLFTGRPTASQSAAQKRWANIEDDINRQIIAAAEAKGDKLSSAEKSEIIDKALIKRAFIRRWYDDDKQRAFINMTADELEKAFTPYDDIPADDLLMLRNFASSVGQAVTERQLEDAHAAALMGDWDRVRLIFERE